MDRTTLKQMLDDGLSLAEIGRRLGRHESTVAYWVDRHGLRANNRERHAARGGLARELLAPMVESGMSIAQIATEVDRSKAAVRHWLRKYGLRTHRSVGSRPREATLEARASGLAEVTLDCSRHGVTKHVRDSRGYLRCRVCRQEAVVRRRQRVKQILVDEAGGCCMLCGYDRSVAGLHFHHLDPREKQFGVAEGGMARSIARLRVEARKCVLLCSNCHAEVEAGISSISAVAQVDDPG
ncbi:MAG TPA: helix-turn-helix domain-containing protein [Solirubrobacteraceae bacterium]|jgi:transposase|nr:helix-turn-helix domain-containing protein [Solirubrobacteraceae bacterium]